MTKAPPRGPPGIPAWLLRFRLPPGDREAVLGDLEEEYRSRADRGVAGVTRWYWWQAGRTVVRFEWFRLARSPRARAGLALALGAAALHGWIVLLNLPLVLGLLRGGVGLLPRVVLAPVLTAIEASAWVVGGLVVGRVVRRRAWLLGLALSAVVVAEPHVAQLIASGRIESLPHLRSVLLAVAAAQIGVWVGRRPAPTHLSAAPQNERRSSTPDSRLPTPGGGAGRGGSP